MSLRQFLVSCPSLTSLRTNHNCLSPIVVARLASTATPPKPDIAVIRKLSEGLPSTIESEKRDQLCTKFWVTLSQAEQKEISDAFKISLQPVRKSPGGSPIDFVSRTVTKLECWVDASTNPACIAILVNKSFITFKLKDGWDKKKDMNHNWAEAVGLELAGRVIIALGYSQIDVCVRSDNLGAIRALSGSESGLQGVNESMGRLRTLLEKSKIKMTGVKVASKENIADAFTRGKFDPAYHRLNCNVPLPKELVPLLHVDLPL